MISPRGSRKAHIFPDQDWDFAGKDYQRFGRFCINKNKTREGNFEVKDISEQFRENKESSNDPTESNKNNQSNNKSC